MNRRRKVEYDFEKDPPRGVISQTTTVNPAPTWSLSFPLPLSPSNPKVLMHGMYPMVIGTICPASGHFYVIPEKTWNQLEWLMDDIEDFYADLPPVTHPELLDLLVPGQVVAARFKGKFHRARIVKVDEESQFQVFSLDYGDLKTVPLRDIRFLEKKHLLALPAQALRCTMMVGAFDWGAKEVEIFQDMVMDKAVAVHFVNKRDWEKDQVWEVLVHGLKEGKDSIVRISSFHLEREVLKMSRGVELSEEEWKKMNVDTDDEWNYNICNQFVDNSKVSRYTWL